MMEDPAQRFRQVVAGVQDARDVVHHNVSLVTPFLYSKMLNVNVSSPRRGLLLIDHVDRSLVVHHQLAWTVLQET